MNRPCCERDTDGDGNCDRHPADPAIAALQRDVETMARRLTPARRGHHWRPAISPLERKLRDGDWSANGPTPEDVDRRLARLASQLDGMGIESATIRRYGSDTIVKYERPTISPLGMRRLTHADHKVPRGEPAPIKPMLRCPYCGGLDHNEDTAACPVRKADAERFRTMNPFPGRPHSEDGDLS